MATQAAPLSPDAGPTDPHLPKLPSGWIAQWDSSSRKYYYVQISTGVSQWDLPTSEAPAGPSRRPEQIPASALDNGTMSGTDPSRPPDGRPEEYSGDRGLGSTAFNLLASQHGGGKQSSGLGGLASSFLGGSKPQGNSHGQSSGHNSGAAGLVGSLASGLLGGNKPHGQQQGSHGTSPAQHQSGGLGGMLGGILGGSHGSGQHGQQNNGYGYSSTGQSSGGYSGTAPPAQYTPSGSASHTPSTGASYPGQPGYNNQYSSPNPQQGHNQYPAPPQHTSSFGHQPQHTSSFGPQGTPSFGPQSPPSFGGPQSSQSFPPPPAQQQQHHAGGYGATPHDQQHGQSGYFNQGVQQAGYGQQGGYGGSHQYPPPPPGGPPQGSYSAAPPAYGQAAPHGGYQPAQHQQDAYSAGYGGQPQGGQHGAYGHTQHQTGYNSGGAPPHSGW